MVLNVNLPKEEVEKKLSSVVGVEKVEPAKGGTLIIVNPQTEVAELRMNLEKLLGIGNVTWIS